MEPNSLQLVRCAICGIMLAGRDQFMGHMFHDHELDDERLKRIWLVALGTWDISEYPKPDKIFFESNNKAQR